MTSYTEDHLVEQPAVQLMKHELGWDVMNCYDEWNGGVSNLGRDGKREVGGNIEHRTSNIEHRTSNIEHRTSNIELPTLNIEVKRRGIRGCGRCSSG